MKRKLLSIFMVVVMLMSSATNIFAATGEFFDKTTDTSAPFTDGLESVYAQMSFTSPIDGDAAIFAATYDGSGKFIKMEMLDTLPVTQGEKVEYTTPEISLDGAHTLKVFAWDSLDSMTALCQPLELSGKKENVTLTLANCDEASKTEYANGTQVTLITPTKTAKTGTYTFVNWTDGVNTYNAGEVITVIKDTELYATWDFVNNGETEISFDDMSFVTAGAYDETTETYDNIVKSVSSGVSGTVNANTNAVKDGNGYANRRYIFVKLDLKNEALAKNVTLNIAGIVNASATSHVYVNKVSGYPAVGDEIEAGTRAASYTLNSTTSGTTQGYDITDIYNKAVGSELYLKIYGWYGYTARYANAVQIDSSTIKLVYTPSTGKDLTVSFDQGAESIAAGVGEIITLPGCTSVIAGRKFAGWSDGTNVYKEGASYKVLSSLTLTATFEADPDSMTNAQKALDGKKVMFIGNSYVYYGNCVMQHGRTAYTWNDRKDDRGYFYQLCKLNNADVTVRNWCFSGHTIYNIFDGPCDNGIECNGISHEDLIEDKYFDYVIVSPHAASKEQSGIETNFAYVMNFFRQYNPNVKFVVLGNHAVYGVTNRETAYPGITNYFKTLEEQGVIVADWGLVVRDIVNQTVAVPGATYDYDINTFVNTSDGYHENALAGYMTALTAFCAITGDAAEGQPYEFASDSSINSKFDMEAYRDKYYTNGAEDTNFVEIMKSEADMTGIQKVIDQYLNAEDTGEDDEDEPVDPVVLVSLTLEDWDEAGTIEYELGTEITLPLPVKTSQTETYTFVEWTDGTNTYKAGDVITLNEDLTLTAIWEVESSGDVVLSFDDISLLKAGPYDSTTETYDNVIKSITSGITGTQDINARNPYSADQGGYLNRPFVYAKIDLKDEVAAEKVMLNLKGNSSGSGKIYVYQVSGYPAVGEEMETGTLLSTLTINSTTTGTIQSVDITDVYNNAIGSELCFRIYGWYGNDSRYTNAISLDASSLNLTYTAVTQVADPVILTLENCDGAGETVYAKGAEVILTTPIKTAKTGTYTFVEWTDGENTYKAGDAITLEKDVTLTAVWEFVDNGIVLVPFDDVSLVRYGAYKTDLEAYNDTVESVTSGITGSQDINSRKPYSSSVGYYIRQNVYVKMDLTNEPKAEKVLLNLNATRSGTAKNYIYVNQVEEYPTAGETYTAGTRIAQLDLTDSTSGKDQILDITEAYNNSVGSNLCIRLIGWAYADEKPRSYVTINASSLSLTVSATQAGDYAVLFDKGAEDFMADAGEVVTLPECSETITGKKFAGWSDGTNVYPAGTEYTVNANVNFVATYEIDPETQTNAQKVLDGKKIIFIGDSNVYWGRMVESINAGTYQQSKRVNDEGSFYQLCKANNIDVSVTNWTFGSHGLWHLFSDEACTVDSCADNNVIHEEQLTDRNFDYVVIGLTRSATDEADIYGYIERIMGVFQEANPNVKFIALAPSMVYGVSDTGTVREGTIASLETLEEDYGIAIADWGRMVRDIINGDTAVPGATLEYNKNSFVTKDKKHVNLLGGYITTMFAYCTLTGEKAEGLTYDYYLDNSASPIIDIASFTSSYYNSASDTNFEEIFESEADMKGLQQLVDQYIEARPYNPDYTPEEPDEPVEPEAPVTLTLADCNEAGTTEYEAGTEVTLVTPTKTANVGTYSFVEWTDGENTYNAGDKITLNENLTLTAVWTYKGGEGTLKWIDSWYFANPYSSKAVTDTTIGTITQNPTGTKYLFRGPSSGEKWTSAYFAKVDLRNVKNVSSSALSVYHTKFNTQVKATVYGVDESAYNAFFANAVSGSTVNTADLPTGTSIITNTYSTSSAAGTYRTDIDITEYIAEKVAAGDDYAYIMLKNTATGSSATTDSWRVSNFSTSSYIKLTTTDDPGAPVILTLADCDEAGATEYASGTQVTLATPVKAAKGGKYTFKNWSDGENTYNAGDVITLSGDLTLTAMWDYESYGVMNFAFDNIISVVSGPYDSTTATYDNVVSSVSEGVSDVINVNNNQPKSSSAYQNRRWIYTEIDLTNEKKAEEVLLNYTASTTGSSANIYVYTASKVPAVGEERILGTKIANQKVTGSAQTMDITDEYNNALGSKLYLVMYGWYGNAARYANAVSLNTGTLSLDVTPYVEGKYTVTFNEGADPIYADTDSEITLPECSVNIPGQKFTGWSDGTTVYEAGATFAVTKTTRFTATYEDDPDSMTAAQKALDGKKVLFIGNSFIYYGRTVAAVDKSKPELSSRADTKGGFIQLCKENYIDVSVTNWTIGAHKLSDLVGTGECDICADGTIHQEYLTDRYYDYIFFSPASSSTQEAEFLDDVDYMVELFKAENPDVKFICIGNIGAYGYSSSKYVWENPEEKYAALEEKGIKVVDWGKLVKGVIDGTYTVPGATETYTKNTFAVKDGYHPNLLTGYMTTLFAYCAVTGEKAEGQPYLQYQDAALSPVIDISTYVSTYYNNGDADTNFPEILKSESEIKCVQQLIDSYLEEENY